MQDIMNTYDRNKSGKRLDDIVRRYIAGHNAVYEGIIYLQSPYRSLAIFALVLAYSFDLSGFVFGFVFGFVIQAKNMRKERYKRVGWFLSGDAVLRTVGWAKRWHL